jgi:hypothetical protein
MRVHQNTPAAAVGAPKVLFVLSLLTELKAEEVTPSAKSDLSCRTTGVSPNEPVLHSLFG